MKCGLEAEEKKKSVKTRAGWGEKDAGEFVEWAKKKRDAN